jgi:hypothetical protein
MGLPFVYFFAHPLKFWLFVGILTLGAICLMIIAVRQRIEVSRFGSKMKFEEILREKEAVRMVQLLRYHLGWSPAKIAQEMNLLNIRNQGAPWRENDIQAIIKRIVGPLP